MKDLYGLYLRHCLSLLTISIAVGGVNCSLESYQPHVNVLDATRKGFCLSEGLSAPPQHGSICLVRM